MTDHFYGWKQSYPDPNAKYADVAGLTTLDEVDPREEMPDPYDQGQLGSCTGNAIAGAVHYNNILDGTDFGIPSRLFIYWNERALENTITQDSGAFGHDGFKVIRKLGVPPEDEMPYNVTAFRAEPNAGVYAAAASHRIGSYVHPGLPFTRSTVERELALKALLSNQQTVAFGFTVYESFESEAVARSGVVPMPDSTEKQVGGHEVLLVGYLADQPDYGLVRNSWGTGWGLGGYFLMPWDYICNPQLASDWRSIYRPATQ